MMTAPAILARITVSALMAFNHTAVHAQLGTLGKTAK